MPAACSRRRLSSFSEGAMPIALGGDHSLGAGSVAAAAAHMRKQGKPLGLIWVDAHGDMNNPASSESGNVHGMPLAALLGIGAGRARALRGSGPGGLAEAHRARRHPQPRRGRKEDRARVEGARLHDEGDRSPWHRRGDGARDRDRHRRAPADFTSRTISTRAIRRSRPASARRSKAASAIARRTS